MGTIFGFVKGGFKLVLLALLLGAVATLWNVLLSLIPALHFGGCMGFWADALGLPIAFRLFISILLYGYTVKFTLSFFKTYL